MKNKELTEHQMEFILLNFFHSYEHPGWRNIATKLIEHEECIVAGTECIWMGGIGNFISVSNSNNLVGCMLYEFDLKSFIGSKWFKEIKEGLELELSEDINELKSKLNQIETLC